MKFSLCSNLCVETVEKNFGHIIKNYKVTFIRPLVHFFNMYKLKMEIFRQIMKKKKHNDRSLLRYEIWFSTTN